MRIFVQLYHIPVKNDTLENTSTFIKLGTPAQEKESAQIFKLRHGQNIGQCVLL